MNTGKIPANKSAITPCLTVKDVAAAAEFYEKAFGLTRHNVMPGPDGKVMHAELLHGGCCVMLEYESEQCNSAAPTMGARTSVGIYLYVENVDTLFAQAKAHNVTVKQEPTDMFWGDRICTMVCPFGHTWTFGTHVREVAPAEMMEAMKKQMAAV